MFMGLFTRGKKSMVKVWCLYLCCLLLSFVGCGVESSSDVILEQGVCTEEIISEGEAFCLAEETSVATTTTNPAPGDDL